MPVNWQCIVTSNGARTVRRISAGPTIGISVGMSENTVRKYIRQLEEQELLFTEPTEIMTRAGQKRNRNLHHTLRPTQEVVNAYYDRQLARLEITVMRQKAAAAQAGM